jgi:2,3-bisphosphoglycerate-independent phosphoglycerate mutase
MVEKYTPHVAVVLDGFGINEAYEGNAVHLAKTKNFDYLKKNYLYTELKSCGKAVGLEKNRLSGSEVGHMNIGAGRVIPQEAKVISEAIKNGEFFEKKVLKEAVKHVKKNKSKLHLMGLVSNNDSPHSRFEHFKALVKFLKDNQVEEVYVHFFTDGRDSPPKSAIDLVPKWEKVLEDYKIGQIKTIGGRFWGMDRTKNWDRLKKAYYAMTSGIGSVASSAKEVILQSYSKEVYDEFIDPTVIINNGHSKGLISNDDSVIFFNLRSDRARQLTKLFVLEESLELDLPSPRLKNLLFVTLTGFGPNINVKTVYDGDVLGGTLPYVLRHKKQLYISETEKFAHVTYFLNGKSADPVAYENRIMIPSPDVDNYKKTPKMSANLITQVVLKYIKSETYDFIFINFANPDMLGHTGDIKATVKGIEFVDKCIGKLYKKIKKEKGSLFIFSDHGNADRMLDKKTKKVITFHSKNPVPLIVASDGLKSKKLQSGGKIANITPTMLDLMHIKKKSFMDDSLLT